MTDQQDPGLEQELRQHYQRTSTVTPPAVLLERVRRDLDAPRSSWSRRSLGAFAAAAVVVVALGALVAAPSMWPRGPSGSATPTPSATVMQPAPTGAFLGPIGADGIPATVDGEPVLNGAAIDARASAADGTPFLIGGSVTRFVYYCRLSNATPVSVLLPLCPDIVKLDGRRLVDELGLVGFEDVNVPMVVRVHVRDRRAADCPEADRAACAQAIVLEQVLWRGPAPGASPSSSPRATQDADGIPLDVAGRTVLRGSAIDEHIAATIDATPFLVGGWVHEVLADCYVPADFPQTPLLAPCGDGALLTDSDPLRGQSDWGRRLVVEPARVFGIGGPLVLRVHVHDPRAGDCPSAYRLRCETAIVVEAAMWVPDREVRTQDQARGLAIMRSLSATNPEVLEVRSGTYGELRQGPVSSLAGPMPSQILDRAVWRVALAGTYPGLRGCDTVSAIPCEGREELLLDAATGEVLWRTIVLPAPGGIVPQGFDTP